MRGYFAIVNRGGVQNMSTSLARKSSNPISYQLRTDEFSIIIIYCFGFNKIKCLKNPYFLYYRGLCVPEEKKKIWFV